MVFAASIQRARLSVWLLSLATGFSQFNVRPMSKGYMTEVLSTDTHQDYFLFAIIVPVLPFALRQQRSNISDDEGMCPGVAVLYSK